MIIDASQLRTIRTQTVGAEQVSFPLAAQAARLLRIGRDALRYKLKKYNLPG
jgi:DNA-binding protein Fis